MSNNDLVNQKVEILKLEKKLSVAELKLRHNAAEKSAETRKVNSKYQLELEEANVKVTDLENRVAQLEDQLKGTKKRGLKKPSPWWYLHTDPVPEHVEDILQAQCKFCHKTFKTSNGKKMGSSRVRVAQKWYRKAGSVFICSIMSESVGRLS